MTDTVTELRGLLAKATPGPWHKRNKVGYVYGVDCVVSKCGDFLDKELLPFNGKRWNADADLIAAARNALPSLLDRLEAAEAALPSLSAFAKDAVSEFWARDSADMQEYGIKHGLLVEVAYDPEKHGDVEDSEKGDLIYVYSDWFKAALSARKEPTA